ncbi:MAG TPA: hypothetical protein VGZ22_12330 [Isosphaeraceae bacterium]|jgi:ElaB/YqjD/DUF883 family membrane-anchored ribosome-binding protein|nr:hypothetical protein [Isosphaeraceae bacterium]
MIDRVPKYESELASQAEQLKEQALDLAAVARERLDEAGQSIKNFVIEHPAKAIGFALGLGVALGWLVKRR